MSCKLHGAPACVPCAEIALKAQVERTTPIFRNGRVAGTATDYRTGKIVAENGGKK